MGRARNGATGITARRFDTVFGANRGVPVSVATLARDRQPGSDYDVLKAAFKALRRNGIAAKTIRSQTEKLDWHPPANKNAFVTTEPLGHGFTFPTTIPDKLVNTLRIGYGVRGNPTDSPDYWDRLRQTAEQTVAELQRHGLNASWTGDFKDKIVVKPLPNAR